MSERRVSFKGDVQTRRMSVEPDSHLDHEPKTLEEQSETVAEDDAMEEAPEGFELEEGPNSKRVPFYRPWDRQPADT